MAAVECPTCGDEFASERGLKVHHSRAHDESIAGKTALCAVCGDEVTRTPAQIERVETVYCSQECLTEGQTDQVQLTCQQCGDEYTRVPAVAEQSKFCSDACRGRAHTGENHPQWSHEIRECSECGDKFNVAESAEQEYCSHDCYLQWRRRTDKFTGENNPNWNSKEYECHRCGASFVRAPSQAEEYERMFCSMECRTQWQRESGIYAGENNPAWNGGRNYYGKNWPEQRRKARERDGYRCQSCGVNESELGRELSVHHITPFEEFVPESGTPDYEAANALNNLVSLCRSCHREYEGTDKRPKLTD